jgi:hypothetical protein
VEKERVVVVLIALCVLSGCARITSDVARKATPGIVESGLESATTPASREKIRDLVSETPVKAQVAGIEGVVVDTIVARLADRDNQQHLEVVAKAVTRSFMEQIAAPKSDQALRAQDALVERAVQAAVRSAAKQMKIELPSLIAEVAANESVKAVLRPIGRSAGEGAVEGAAETITGREQEAQ